MSEHFNAAADKLPASAEFYPLRGVDVTVVIACWSFLALVSSVTRQLDPRIPGLQPSVASAVMSATYVEYALWSLLTIPILWLTTRYSIEGGRRLGRVLVFVVVGLVVAVWMDTLLLWVRESIFPLPRGRFRRQPVPFWGFGFVDDLMVYLAVFGSGVARDYFLRYRARAVETARLQAQLTQARLDALRSQLNPHFLFNTLNAVSALVDRDAAGARRMIARLSDLLRYTLEESHEQEVPLQRELDVLGEYVELMQIRFQGRLDVSIDVDQSVGDALVPNLLLQPIVENAIRHGVGRMAGQGRIEIDAKRLGEKLVIRVEDNGPGPASGSGNGAGGGGVGLRNTNERLAEMYGPEHRVSLLPRPQGGTRAEITIPYHRAGRA